MKKILKSMIFIIFSAILFLVFPISAGAEETELEKQLVSSSGFESGAFQGWAAFGSRSSVFITDETAHEGKYCIKTGSRGVSWSGPFLNIINLVEPGTDVTIQAYVKAVEDDVTPEVALAIKSIAEGGGEKYVDIASSVVDSTDWVKIEGTYSIPEETTELVVYFQTTEGLDNFYVDDIKIMGIPKGTDISDDAYNGESYSFDFERNLQKWMPRGELSVVITKDYCYSGNYSLYVSDRTKFWHSPMVHLNEVKPGKSYNYTAYVMYNGSEYEQNHVFAIKLQYNLNGVETYSEIANKVLQKDTWSKISGDYTLPEGAENIVFYIQTEDVEDEPTTNDLMSFYIDNVVIFDNTELLRQQTIHMYIVISVSVLSFVLVAFIIYLIYKKSRKTKEVLLSASMDAMTKTFNRNTFEEFIKKLEENPDKCKKYYMTVCDVNFLKYINDNYGHEFGDMAIIRCAEVLSKTIGKRGKVYRTGGDEFMCVTRHNPSDELKAAISLESSLHYKGYPFSVAVGTARYDKTIDFDTPDIKAIMKRSDGEMYKHKQEIKKYKTEFSKEFSVDRKASTVQDDE